MRRRVIVLSMLLGALAPAFAQVSIGIGTPNVQIGITLPVYPELVRVPNYPVYYAPRLGANYFFFDGLYWVYEGDNWYASSWYNGPWGLVAPQAVPVYILRVPLRYYRRPPDYFRAGRRDAPPPWNEHWGRDWEQQRPDWNRRDRSPPPAPPPSYQRRYPGQRYPSIEQQRELQQRNYRYQPRDDVVRQHYEEQRKFPHQQAPNQGPGQGQGKDKNRDKREDRGQDNKR